jgi:hypothetical protein
MGRLTDRVHEWFAEHVKWVQYPNVVADRPGVRLKLQMPAGEKALILICGVILIGFALIFGYFCLLAFWAMLP